jgi:cyclohexyl-isocyanide hydratase
VLAEIAGEDFAKSVQLGLEYAPAPPFDSGHPSTASADIRARFDSVRAKMMEQRTEEARKAAAMMLG